MKVDAIIMQWKSRKETLRLEMGSRIIKEQESKMRNYGNDNESESKH